MPKRKRKLNATEKAAKRRMEFMIIFVNGKQKRVRRPTTIDGMDADEFILRNADPIWLHQSELWQNLVEDSDLENPNQSVQTIRAVARSSCLT